MWGIGTYADPHELRREHTDPLPLAQLVDCLLHGPKLCRNGNDVLERDVYCPAMHIGLKHDAGSNIFRSRVATTVRVTYRPVRYTIELAPVSKTRKSRQSLEAVDRCEIHTHRDANVS